MPRRTTKPTQSAITPTKCITVLGILKPTGWDIPEDLRHVEIDDVEVGILQITLEGGKSYVIDRSGVNFGIPVEDWEEIQAVIKNMGFSFTDMEVYPIISNDGRNMQDYSPEDGKNIARFIRSYPTLSSRLLSLFTSPRNPQ